MKLKNKFWLFLLGCGAAISFIGNELAEAQDTKECDPPEQAKYFSSVQEASGAKYRKIGLNGFPIPDEKPQQKEESDSEPEETYIDAFNLGLSHQITDVYIPFQGTDLTLTVRRNWAPEILDDATYYWMYHVHQRPDRPFGACWQSSVGASIRFEYPFPSEKLPLAYVVDENGVTYKFLIMAYTGSGTQFFPMPENRNQQEVLATSLKITGSDTFEFSRKFKTKIDFKYTGAWIRKLDAIVDDGTTPGTDYFWARAESMTDRFNTTLTYHYPSGSAMIPDSITCRGKTLSITNVDGLITQVEDPNGNKVKYHYDNQTLFSTTLTGTAGSTVFSATMPLLVSGTKVNGAIYVSGSRSIDSSRPDSVTTYGYAIGVEPNDTPTPPDSTKPIQYYHLDLGSVTDGNDNTYTFGYTFDHTHFAFDSDYGYYHTCGEPSNIHTVVLPAITGTVPSGTATFTNDSSVQVEFSLSGTSLVPAVVGQHRIEVADAQGGNWQYDFTEPDFARLNEFEELIYPDTSGSFSLPYLVSYKKMTVSTPESGTMVATFEPAAGMALSSFQDVFSTGTTTYEYADTFDYTFQIPWLPSFLLPSVPTTKWGDPTKQTNGEGGTKIFTYDGTWRIMDSVTDENGHYTSYTISSTNGNRTAEYIKTGSGGTTVQETDFDYSNSFPGIVTKKTIVTSGTTDPAWVKSLVTSSTLQTTTGNVLAEVTGTGTSASVTQHTYDDNNNKATTTDPNGNVTSFTYDGLNHLVKAISPATVVVTGSVTGTLSGTKSMFYDARGNKTREDDELGHSTLLEYDGLNRVTKQVRDMNGDHTINTGTTSTDLITSSTYNKLNAKVAETSPNGWTTTMEYDGLRRLTKTTDPYSFSTTYTYGNNSGGLQFGRDFQPATVSDPRGYVTSGTYDNNYRQIAKSVQYKLTGSNQFAISYTGYDAVGNVISGTDPLGNVTTHAYDAMNRETSTVYPATYILSGTLPVLVSGSTQTFYTKTGLKYKTIDELGNDTLTEYDDKGRPVSVSSPVVAIGNTGSTGRAVTQTAYDKANNPIQTTNPLNYVWTSTFDARNRKIAEVRPGTGSPTVRTVYDLVGNVKTTTDARGNVTTNTYDDANRLTQIQLPNVVYFSGSGRPTTIKYYDNNGNVTKVTDPNGHDTVNTYDKLNRLLTSTDPESIVVTGSYDSVGNRTLVKDGLNQATTFEYDGLNRNTKVTDAASKYYTYEYNAINKTARVDSKSQRTEYAYDGRNRLTTVSYKNSSGTTVNDGTNATRSYGYDLSGNLLSITELAKSGKADVAYAYDALHRQTSETSSGLTHTYKYDLAGNRVYCLYGGWSSTLVSAYDAQNRLYTLTSGTRVTTYGYDLDSNVTSKTHANGQVVSTSYDAANRVSELKGLTSSGTEQYKYLPLWDANGNLKKSTETYPQSSYNRVMTLTYDNANRLTQEAVTSSGGMISGTSTYGYDNANNLTSYAKSGTTSTLSYNSLNQITSLAVGGRTVTYTYDDNGSRITEADPRLSVSSPRNTSYGYDYENRLVSLQRTKSSESALNQFTYDYRTRRVERKRTGNTDPADATWTTGTDKIVFSGGTSIREYSGTTLSVDYIRGSDWGGGVGGILYTLRSGTAAYTHYDTRGDVTMKSNDSQTVTYIGDYTALGGRVKEYQSTPDRQKSNTKDEDVLGYANEGFRYRQTEIGEGGMFLSRDPAGFIDGPNLYTYVNQNPWTKFDPEGLRTLKQVRKAIDDRNEENRALNKRQTEINNTTKKEGRARTPEEQKEYENIGSKKLRNEALNFVDSIVASHLEASAKAIAAVTRQKVEDVESTLDDQDANGSFNDGLTLARTGRVAELVGSYYGGKIVGWAGGKLIGSILGRFNAGEGLGNPFKGKSPVEIDKMFKAKGFEPRGPDPLNGKGGYVNPKTGRSYHIDEANSFGEEPHVDVNRPKAYDGPLDKKKYPTGE